MERYDDGGCWETGGGDWRDCVEGLLPVPELVESCWWIRTVFHRSSLQGSRSAIPSSSQLFTMMFGLNRSIVMSSSNGKLRFSFGSSDRSRGFNSARLASDAINTGSTSGKLTVAVRPSRDGLALPPQIRGAEGDFITRRTGSSKNLENVLVI